MQQAIHHFLSSRLEASLIREGRSRAAFARVVISGSFNPLHTGHLQMAAFAAEYTQVPVEFDLSVHNADKPSIDAREILRRARMIPTQYAVWLTRVTTFAAKAAAMPQTTFAVGADTIVRVADPKYYRGSAARRDKAIRRIRNHGCRFLVFGRVDVNDYFLTLHEMDLPSELLQICTAVAESDYRCDLSSTAIRARQDDREGNTR